MKILILGGTQFVGRHLTLSALKAGHEVTLFNRGKTQADLFPNVEKIVGDRDGDLQSLKNREWDSVIDVNGYIPRIVSDSVNLLKDSVEKYIFISTMAVYHFDRPINEDSEVKVLKDPTIENFNTNEEYAGLKVLCERSVLKVFGDDALIVRPHNIVGIYDHTDRFAYWIWRAAQGGKMLSPGSPDEATQAIDCQDMSEWIIRMAEKGKGGLYNAAAPRFKFSEVLEKSKELSNSDTEFLWISGELAKDKDLLPKKMPFWHPGKEYSGILNASYDKVVKEGMKFKSIETIVTETLPWIINKVKNGHNLSNGFNKSEEAELIKKLNIK